MNTLFVVFALAVGFLCGWCACLFMTLGRNEPELTELPVVDHQIDMADAYETREARRIERALEHRSVAGVVYIDKK